MGISVLKLATRISQIVSFVYNFILFLHLLIATYD